MIIDLKEKLEVTRYNGGWTKTVVGLDKSKQNGYSLIGEFLPKQTTLNLEAGRLYLDCDIRGSRKNNTNNYTLFTLLESGEVEILAEEEGASGYTRGKTGRDWALRLWEPIENFFARKNVVDVVALQAEREKLMPRIAEIDKLLAE